MLVAYRNHGITMTALAAELGLSVSRTSRLISRAESDEGRLKVR
jgi:DNA-binding MarR family transcriptional regulator